MGADESRELTQARLEDLKNKTKFSVREIREWYEKFYVDYPDGIITKDAFIDMYSAMFPKGDARQFAAQVFRAYDADGNGEIDFQEFLTTLSIASHGSPDDKLRWAFKMYDQNGDGQVSRREATDIIHSIYKMRGMTDFEKAQELAEQLFIILDKDMNDHLSEREFVRGAKHSPAVMDLLSGN